MNRKIRLALLLLIPLAGIVAGYLLMGRMVILRVDGQPVEVFTRALTVRGVLRSAGYEIYPEDRVSPPSSSWLSRATEVELNSSRTVSLRLEPGGQTHQIKSAALTPAELLQHFGIEPSPWDGVKINGDWVAMDANIGHVRDLTLQYYPAVQVQVDHDDDVFSFETSAQTLGAALFREGILVRGADLVNPPLDTPLKAFTDVVIRSARAVKIKVDGKTINTYTAAESVAGALQQAGVLLQDLDYSVPGERQPVPADGVIRVVRVREELLLEQTTIPFETRMVGDTELEVNERVVMEEGRDGVKATRVRVRYEDGVEISRSVGEEIMLVSPVARVIHYGSNINDKVIDTPNGPITYYMAVDVVVTSYSPCRSGTSTCYGYTALGLPVQKGVIGVSRSWYDIFKGYTIYVPGYGVGTIADIGAYPGTTKWIDLGYTDADYVPWGAVNVTIYFLSPAPPAFTGVLP